MTDILTFHDIFFLVVSALCAVGAIICSIMFFVCAAALKKESKR